MPTPSGASPSEASFSARAPQGFLGASPFPPEPGRPLIELLGPRAGERILDIGCGSGTVSRLLASHGASVVGIDPSPALVTAAREKGIDARVEDAHELSYQEEFDAAFSNAALHWLKADPQRVLYNVRRALKPGGRFVGEMGGDGNVRTIRDVIHRTLRSRGIDPEPVDPWYFPSLEEYRAKLERADFTVDRIEIFPRPTLLFSGVQSWLDTHAWSFLGAVPEAQRPAFRTEVISQLRPHLCDSTGSWTADYVRLRFRARVKA